MNKQEKSVRNIVINGICLFFLMGAVACNTSERNANTASERIDEEESEMAAENTWDNNRFNTDFASNNRYGEWDANRDNYLDENEYSGGFYRTWDTNRDNKVDQNEWNTASKDFGMENQTWDKWDANRDGSLDENEYRTGFNQSGWYSEWDGDGDKRLSQQEYSTGLFGRWDRNRDSMLDENEYSPYNTYYGNGTGNGMNNGAGTGTGNETGTGTGSGTDEGTGAGNANRPGSGN